MVFVLQEWTSSHPSFFDKWETWMSSLAMADLLSHYLATRDKHLVAMETVGESTWLPFGRGCEACRRYEYLVR